MPFKRILDEEGNVLRVRARYTLREMYIEEFERIWQRQAEHLGLENIKVSSKKKSCWKVNPFRQFTEKT
jgi:CRISPR-associated endonuclease Csn1